MRSTLWKVRAIDGFLRIDISKKTRDSLQNMKDGEVLSLRDTDGYRIIKLNKKRFYGNSNFKYSF